MKGCRAFTVDEVGAMEKALGSREGGARDVALFVLGYQTGRRISEVLSLTIGDVTDATGVKHEILFARRNIKRKTEGFRAYLPPRAREVVGVLIEELRSRGFIGPKDWLFQGHRWTGARLSRAAAWRMVRWAAGAAGISGPIGTHSMRKTFAVRLYEHCLKLRTQGEVIDPLVETQMALGHVNIESTIKYLSVRNENTRRLCEEVWGT